MDYRRILGNMRGMHHKRRGVFSQVPCFKQKDKMMLISLTRATFDQVVSTKRF